MVKSELKKTFNPEFINRVDEVIVFNMLADEDLIRILELLVQQLNVNLAEREITLTVTAQAKKWIFDQTVSDRSYGARPLRRALQRHVEDPLSEALIRGSITGRPAFVEIYLEDGQLYYREIGQESESNQGLLLHSS